MPGEPKSRLPDDVMTRVCKAADATLAKVRRGPLGVFLTDHRGEELPAHAAGDLVSIGDETWRVGYAKGDTLLLERVRPDGALDWSRGEADPLADLKSR